MSTGKTLTALGLGVAAAAIGVAVVQWDKKQEARTALAASIQRSEALQAELAKVNARLVEAERRAAEAEKDSGELLKAVAAFRAQQATQPVRPAAAGGSANQTPEEEDRLVQERIYQQQLAKRRAEDAKARARIDHEGAMKGDAAAHFNRLIEAAEHLAANGEFQAGIRMYNEAIQMKPPTLEVSEGIKQLQGTLAAQNRPVDVTVTSDGLTWVSIVNYRQPEKLSTLSVKILPGNYQLVGRRKGYQDVEIPLQVRNGVPAPAVSVRCTTPLP